MPAGPGDAVYVSGYGLVAPDSGPVLGSWAAALPPAVLLFVDPGPLVAQIPAEVLDPVLARCDWLSCNAREAALLTDAATPDEATRRLIARTTRASVIVRIGPDGCLLAARPPAADATHPSATNPSRPTAGRPTRIPAPHAPPAPDGRPTSDARPAPDAPLTADAVPAPDAPPAPDAVPAPDAPLTADAAPAQGAGPALGAASASGAGPALGAASARSGASARGTATATVHIPAPTVRAVDTTGAGDAHAGVFLAALADGLSAAGAACRANAAAALAVTRPGPATSPDRAELDAWLAQR